MIRGQSDDSGVPERVLLGFSTSEWRVAPDYRLEPSETILGDPVSRVVRVGGATHRWVIRPPIAEALNALREASDEVILDWVRRHGFVGLEGDPDADAETTQDVRGWLAQLHRCRLLMQAIRRGDPPDDLLESARRAAGHVINPNLLMREVGLHELLTEPRRAGADADVQAMVALSRALGLALARLRIVEPWISTWSSDERLHLVPRFHAKGPLAVAYVETVGQASTLSVAWSTGKRSTKLAVRPCAHCGRMFQPRTLTNQWCGKRCRWTADQAARRDRLREVYEDGATTGPVGYAD